MAQDQDQEQEDRPRLVVDNSRGGEMPADLFAMLQEVGTEMGYDVVHGPVLACDGCGFFECVCLVRKEHEETCRYRKAMECPVDVPCAHDLQACPECDKCDCKGAPTL